MTLTDADRIAGLLQVNASLTQRMVDLEINLASMRRLLVEKDAEEASRVGEAKK
jgi:hypothetical protein